MKFASIVARLLCATLLFSTLPAFSATLKNDDSCDIAQLPAATLLLPYFEVDLSSQSGDTTLITIANVTNVDRIARVTLWTDYAYPVIAFNIYLTGYDVQAINLFDVIERGVIAPDEGTGTDVSKRGQYSDQNFGIDLTGCTRQPGPLDPVYIARMQAAFLTGQVPALGSVLEGCGEVGLPHEKAVGYATIDVVRTCAFYNPTDPLYWLEDIAFDNVLTGDYQQVDGANNSAQGNPLVHIRAIPEGGGWEERRDNAAAYDAGFPRTFYGRYQSASAPRFDARQPLPSVFATRWITGSIAFFQTSLKIWREGRTGAAAPCAEYQEKGLGRVGEMVRFDEAENAFSDLPDPRVNPPVPPSVLPATSRNGITDNEVFPHVTNGAVAGWIYLNLNDCVEVDGECEEDVRQAWVVTSMRAQERFSVDMDGTALGNGCSPAVGDSEVGAGSGVIGPAANEIP